MKINIGDRVKIINNFPAIGYIGNVNINKEMYAYVGKILEVSSIDKSDNTFKAKGRWWPESFVVCKVGD